MPKLGYSSQNGRGLSYSRLQTLHSCPRKYEIENVIGYRPKIESMTFAYGHFVGAGIQEYLATRDLNKALLAGMLEFDLNNPWEEGSPSEIRSKKSFWHAMDIVEKFATELESNLELIGAFKNLEIAKFPYQEKEIPALELTFEILIDNDGEKWVYEGHIDAVLYNPKKNEYIILELKTTSSTKIHPAQYENSAQALGYAIVLDKIVESKNAKSSFSVLYLVAQSGQKTFETLKFPKSILKRSQWINSLLLDINHIEMLEHAAKEAEIIYPQNGANCYQFFKPCPYFGLCDYDNKRFKNTIDKETESFAKQEPVMFSFTLEEIIARQEFLLSDKTNNALEMEKVSMENDGLEDLENW